MQKIVPPSAGPRTGLGALLAALVLAGCSNPGASRSALEKAGFRDIQTGGYAWMSCSKDDTFATSFTATNPMGMRVSGVVCCGLMKDCTIRF